MSRRVGAAADKGAGSVASGVDSVAKASESALPFLPRDLDGSNALLAFVLSGTSGKSMKERY